MIQHESTRRWRITRAIERGDPRLGLFIGFALSIAAATAFVRRDVVFVADRLENLALDYVFQVRPAIPESDRIALIYIDDNTLKKIRWPFERDNWAKAVIALDRLGATQISFDVLFKMVVPRPRDYDPDTGEYRLSPENRALRWALGRSGNAVLAYYFEEADPLPAEIRERFGTLREAFAANILADEGEVASRAGMLPGAVREWLEAVRVQAVVSLVAERLEREPNLTFREVRDAFLPKFDARVQLAELNLVHYAYWLAKGRKMLLEKSAATRVEGMPEKARTVYALTPPEYFFLEKVRGVGFVNARVDADGVMRRPWTHLIYEGRPYAYMGLESALLEAPGPGEGVETVLGREGIRISVQPRTGPSKPPVELPLDPEGRLLVDWAKNRGGGPGRPGFVHLPFIQLISFYQARYEALDLNVRRTILQIPESDRPAEYAEYLALSDRLGKALQGESELDPAESRRIEARMDEIRRLMMKEMQDEAGMHEEALARNPGPRVRKASEEALAKIRPRLAAFGEADRMEERLRKIVAGRLCMIGSASTGSGDLQPTPLSSMTPGMDVIANVANMALTGRSLHRVPGWVDFLYLLAVGLAVSMGVAHWNATASAAFSLAVMAVTVGFYMALFMAWSVLVTGAGPVITAAGAFAAVTAYKELVTQRSKKKLQRELEKNTSEELVKILMEHPEFLAKPRKMVGTFFFSDVKSFTSISEKMAPEILVPFINRYLDRQTQALKNHLAFLDKYIGDGIMALFGIPVPSPHHARNACRAALECQAVLKGLNVEFAAEGLPQIKTRIGIHSGEVIAGYVGASNRSDYTVLGDSVNLASRLEGANKEYESSIMISEATYDLVGGEFQVRELDKIRVVGKRNAVRIFELLAPAGAPLPFDGRFLAEYEAALGAFKERRWAEAIEGFERALAIKPGDKPAETYISRANAFQLSPPPPDWEGVFELMSK